jgi:hypothetical protein
MAPILISDESLEAQRSLQAQTAHSLPRNDTGTRYHECDCDRLTVIRENEDFKEHFEATMKDYDPSSGHRNVAVLLLSWENGDLAGLDEEVCRLFMIIAGIALITAGELAEGSF